MVWKKSLINKEKGRKGKQLKAMEDPPQSPLKGGGGAECCEDGCNYW